MIHERPFFSGQSQRLEETGRETKESASFKYLQRSGICVEQNTNGWMGGSTKSSQAGWSVARWIRAMDHLDLRCDKSSDLIIFTSPLAKHFMRRKFKIRDV